jgi:hypothetical protein
MRDIADLIQKLKSTAANIDASVDLLLDVFADLKVVVADLETSPAPPTNGELRKVVRGYLAKAPAKAIREDLVVARGVTAAAHLATDLNTDLAALGCARRPLLGRGRNGRGANGRPAAAL